DAEPRYMVSVRPARVSNNKKSCSGRNKTQKPLQLVVGTLTPTSVFLSWGILVNPQHDWTTTSNCGSDRIMALLYHEPKEDNDGSLFPYLNNKKLCFTALQISHKVWFFSAFQTSIKSSVEQMIKCISALRIRLSQDATFIFFSFFFQIILGDNKKLVPVTIIKQIIQNRTQSKAPDSSSLPGAILVHLIVPGLNESQQKLPPLLTIDDIPQASRKKLAKNETGVWPAESKTPELQEISPQSLPGIE
ncbi:TARSH protein, partial [Alaudala cheleensis]|nr:TARSH protein [Alaudala cheleensis]